MTNPLPKDINDTVSVVENVVSSQRNIQAVCVRTFTPPPSFQTRFEPSVGDLQLIAAAQNLRATDGLPFPDALLIAAMDDRNAMPSSQFLAAVGYHHDVGPCAWVARSQVERGALRHAVDTQAPGSFMGISSVLKVADGSEQHLPMLDFRARPGGRALELVIAMLRHTAPTPGWVLASGRSYHFIGNTPIAPHDSALFLARASLYGSLVDRNWIAHQLLSNFCTLRLGGNPQSQASAPIVVAET